MRNPTPEECTMKDQWITEIRMFQRVAGTPESSYEELAAEWDMMKSARARRQALISIQSHRAIQNVTRK